MSNAYVLKYNIKYTLADPAVSQADKQQLRQVQRECDYMQKGFYLYCFCDFMFSSYMLNKQFAHNTHSLNKYLQTRVIFLTLRLSGLYGLE